MLTLLISLICVHYPILVVSAVAFFFSLILLLLELVAEADLLSFELCLLLDVFELRSESDVLDEDAGESPCFLSCDLSLLLDDDDDDVVTAAVLDLTIESGSSERRDFFAFFAVFVASASRLFSLIGAFLSAESVLAATAVAIAVNEVAVVSCAVEFGDAEAAFLRFNSFWDALVVGADACLLCEWGVVVVVVSVSVSCKMDESLKPGIRFTSAFDFSNKLIDNNLINSPLNYQIIEFFEKIKLTFLGFFYDMCKIRHWETFFFFSKNKSKIHENSNL